MSQTVVHDDTLPALLHDEALRITPRHHAVSLVAGSVAMLGAALAPSLLSALLAAAGGCQVAFGAWGLATRRLLAHESAVRDATERHADDGPMSGAPVATDLSAGADAAGVLLNDAACEMHLRAARRCRLVRSVAAVAGGAGALLFVNLFAFGFIGRWMS